MRELTLKEKGQARLQVLNLVLDGRIGVGEAAALMGLSERQSWRLLDSYRKEGANALVHGNGGRRPVNATPESVKLKVVNLARDKYAGLNHTHFAELLEEREGLTLSRSTVRGILNEVGVTSHRHKRSPRYRCRRARTPQEGMLIQMDGSSHDWLEGRGPCFTLLLAVDDATGTVPYALFREQEDTYGYFLLIEGIIRSNGIPMAIYTDRHSVFRVTRPAFRSMDRGGKRCPTQFTRAMDELGISMIVAKSPQGKGRVEKMNGTFQDRLVSELRLAGACSMQEAGKVLDEFLPRFNLRFGVLPVKNESAYRPVNPGLNLETVLCNHHIRKVARDNTVRCGWRILQLLPNSDRRSYAGTRVQLREYHDGRLEVLSNDTLVSSREVPAQPGYFNSARSKRELDLGNLPSWLEKIMGQKSDDKTPASTSEKRPTVRQQARWDAIQEARGQGLSQRAMAKLLRMSRKTIRRYKSSVTPPLYPPRHLVNKLAISN